MLYRQVFDKISTEFRGILRAFVNFADLPEFHGFATARNTTSPELRHLHDSNWWLKICIWRLYFCSWSPKGDLRIFLISSPDMLAWRYEFYFLVTKTIFYSLTPLVRKILFCHPEIKFISSCHHVISSLYKKILYQINWIWVFKVFQIWFHD